MKKGLFIIILVFIISFTGNKRQPFLVNIEKIRVTQAADLSSIPGTTADMMIVVDRSAAIASGTLPLPANPVDGQIFMISSRVDFGSVILNTNGRAISGAITAVSAGDFVGWVYDLISDRWFPYGSSTSKDLDLLAYQEFGSPIFAETIGQKLAYCNAATNLVDGQIKWTGVYLSKAETLTGIRVYSRTAGSYTADNNNRIGLYSYNKTTGLLTLVASSANNGTLWTSTANAQQLIPFSATFDAVAGAYAIAYIYNQSAQVTAPAIGAGISLNNLSMAGTALGLANSAKIYGTSTGTDLPATINMSAITASVVPTWTAVY